MDTVRTDYINKVLYGQEMIERKDDMSFNGHLTVSVQPDGDMCVSIYDSEREQIASIEFCQPGMGGGGSPRTHAALRELFVAMVEDQAVETNSSRNGRFEVDNAVTSLIMNALES